MSIDTGVDDPRPAGPAGTASHPDPRILGWSMAAAPNGYWVPEWLNGSSENPSALPPHGVVDPDLGSDVRNDLTGKLPHSEMTAMYRRPNASIRDLLEFARSLLFHFPEVTDKKPAIIKFADRPRRRFIGPASGSVAVDSKGFSRFEAQQNMKRSRYTRRDKLAEIREIEKYVDKVRKVLRKNRNDLAVKVKFLRDECHLHSDCYNPCMVDLALQPPSFTPEPEISPGKMGPYGASAFQNWYYGL